MSRFFTFCGTVLLTAALARPTQAQTPTPRQWLDNHFAQLDKSQVPTGMLAAPGRWVVLIAALVSGGQ